MAANQSMPHSLDAMSLDAHSVTKMSLSPSGEGAGRMFDALTGDSRCVDSQGGREFLRQLVGAIGTQNDPGAVRTVLKYLQKNDGTSAAFWS